MNALHCLYHLVRSDFSEQARQYGFLIILGAAVYLACTIACWPWPLVARGDNSQADETRSGVFAARAVEGTGSYGIEH